MREKLSSPRDFKKAREDKCVILVNNPTKSTAKRTRIHRPTCYSLDNIPGVLSAADNIVIEPASEQEYWYYDSVDSAKADYSLAKPCSRCKP